MKISINFLCNPDILKQKIGRNYHNSEELYKETLINTWQSFLLFNINKQSCQNTAGKL